jgi:hypothetical protein
VRVPVNKLGERLPRKKGVCFRVCLRCNMSLLGHSRHFGALPSTSGPPPGTDMASIPRIVPHPVRRGSYGRPRHRKLPPCWRSARSHADVYSPVPACYGLRYHRATAKQYCSSSSFVARQSVIPGHSQPAPKCLQNNGFRDRSASHPISLMPTHTRKIRVCV